MAAECFAAQLRLLSSCAVQRRCKAGTRNGQLAGNNLPALPATREAEGCRALLEDRSRHFGEGGHSVCSGRMSLSIRQPLRRGRRLLPLPNGSTVTDRAGRKFFFGKKGA